jgi:hypothetical protein
LASRQTAELGLTTPEPTPSTIAPAVLNLVFYVWLALIPTIMLHSLIVKRLNGFASCLGMLVSLTVFISAILLPGELALMEFWSKIASLPDPVKILVGLLMPEMSARVSTIASGINFRSNLLDGCQTVSPNAC